MKNLKADFDKYIAAVSGLVVGDALGVPTEFKSRANMKDNPVTDMIGYGIEAIPEEWINLLPKKECNRLYTFDTFNLFKNIEKHQCDFRIYFTSFLISASQISSGNFSRAFKKEQRNKEDYARGVFKRQVYRIAVLRKNRIDFIVRVCYLLKEYQKLNFVIVAILPHNETYVAMHMGWKYF